MTKRKTDRNSFHWAFDKLSIAFFPLASPLGFRVRRGGRKDPHSGEVGSDLHLGAG